MTQKILAVIPARGGSKGVPRKNLRFLAGKPLVIYAIEAALVTQHPLKVIVSTDDHEIAKLARQAHAEVPFTRPAELARDESPMMDVVLHSLQWLRANEDYQPDAVMLLQPTSPLRTTAHIDAAVELFIQSRADSVVSVCESEHSPHWMMRVDDAGRAAPFLLGEPLYSRRQDLPKTYRLNGAIYLATREFIEKERSFLGPDTRALIMSQEDSIDINTELDFKLAELLLQQRSPAQKAQ